MIDNKTSHRQYPLPDAGNLLSEDVGRLAQALGNIDADIHAASSAREADNAAQQAENQNLYAAIGAESTAREQAIQQLKAADGSLSGQLAAETAARQSADNTLIAQLKKKPHLDPGRTLMTDEQRQALSALLNIDLQTASSERLIELCLLYRAYPGAAEGFPQALRDEIVRRYDAGTIAADDVTYAVLQRFANDLPASIPHYKALLQEMAAAPDRDLWLAAHELDFRTAIHHPEIVTWLASQTAILQKCLASPLALEWMAQSAPMAAAIFADNGATSLWQGTAHLWSIWPRYTAGMRVLAQVPAQVDHILGDSAALAGVTAHAAARQALLHFPASRASLLAHEGFLLAVSQRLSNITKDDELALLMGSIVGNAAAKTALISNNGSLQAMRHVLYDMAKKHWRCHRSASNGGSNGTYDNAVINNAMAAANGLVFACLSSQSNGQYTQSTMSHFNNQTAARADKTQNTTRMTEVSGVSVNGARFYFSNGTGYAELWVPN